MEVMRHVMYHLGSLVAELLNGSAFDVHIGKRPSKCSPDEETGREGQPQRPYEGGGKCNTSRYVSLVVYGRSFSCPGVRPQMLPVSLFSHKKYRKKKNAWRKRGEDGG